MADDPAVRIGETVNPEPDLDDRLGAEDGDDHSVLTGGGDKEADIDVDRAITGAPNDDKVVNEVRSDENSEANLEDEDG